MMYDLARDERAHLAINAEPAAETRPKRCACGRTAFAKQLVQYGKCVACVLADLVATLHPGDIDKLRHALGAIQHRPKRTWGLRNYYCAGRGGASEAAMRRMVAAGFMHTGYESEDQAYFHATKTGCKLAGLDAAGVRRALGGQP